VGQNLYIPVSLLGSASLTSARPGKQQVDTVARPGRRKQLEALARPS